MKASPVTASWPVYQSSIVGKSNRRLLSSAIEELYRLAEGDTRKFAISGDENKAGISFDVDEGVFSDTITLTINWRSPLPIKEGEAIAQDLLRRAMPTFARGITTTAKNFSREVVGQSAIDAGKKVEVVGEVAKDVVKEAPSTIKFASVGLVALAIVILVVKFK